MTRPRSVRGRHQRPFTTGLLVSQGFRATLANLGPFFLITLLCLLPALVYQYLTLFNIDPEQLMQAMEEMGAQDYLAAQARIATRTAVIQFLLSTFLGFVAQAAVCYGTIQYLSGRRAGFGECLVKGLSRLFPVLGVSILAGLLVVGGLILLVVPGIMLFCGLYVAVPAAVVEAPGLKGALKRSFALTRGHRGAIFLALLGLGLLGGLAGGLVGLLGARLGDLTLNWIVQQVLAIFFAAVGAALTGVAYALLRERKEGVSVAQLAEVFA